MEELAHTSDPVFLSRLVAALDAADIHAVVFDAHTAGVFPGLMDALAARVMVDAEAMPKARQILGDLAGAASDDPVETSEDTLLNGRVTLRQPAQGYRAAIDPVLLAASLAVRPHQTVLDAGCGVGAASLCLLARAPEVSVVGIDCQPGLVDLARDNAAANGVSDRFDILDGDITQPPTSLEPGSFDQVMSNPPFMETDSGHAPPDPSKAIAHVESGAILADWVRFCFAMVRRKGAVTFIHRADRLDALLAAIHGLGGDGAGDVVIFPLWPRVPAGSDAKPAKRVIVRARRGVQTPTTLSPGLVLHDADGAYTPMAGGVLNDADALPVLAR